MGTTALFEGRLTKTFWIGLAVVLGLLAVLGFVVDRAVLRVQRQVVSESLRTMLAASERSVTSWLDDRKQFMGMLVKTIRIREAIGPILQGKAKDSRLLRAALDEFAAPFKLHNGMLLNTKGMVVFAHDDKLVGNALPQEAAPWMLRALQGEACIAPTTMIDLGKGKVPAMLAMAPASGLDGVAHGILLLTLDPSDFSAILALTQPGQTGETFAFDRQGRMISESRFLKEIVAAGVLPDGTTSTVLTLDLRDPGVNLMSGQRSNVQRTAQPLTRLVTSALSGEDGIDVDGYTDYRGVKGVAAWTWVDKYDFGLEVRMDYAEAFAPHFVLRYIFFGLMGVLVVVSVVFVVYTLLNARKRRQLETAASKAEKLGQYHLERKLGEGGMGEVYLGHHALLRRPTAIKLMRGAAKDADKRRFEQEVQTSSRLTHPNTIAIFDYGHTVEGVFFYAMEYLEGMDLGSMVDRFGPLPPARVLHFLAQVCGSLQEAHEHRLIHRDIKPENIMSCRRGGVHDTVKVLDFGLVKSLDSKERLTLAATVMGTPNYMAPEAINGNTLDARSDLYSLGCVAWFLLTGHQVFEKKSVMDIMMAHLQAEPMPPSRYAQVPGDLEAIVMQLLLKDPARRPPDALSLRRMLLACQDARGWTDDDARRWWEEHMPLRKETAEAGQTALAPLRIRT